MKSLWNGNVLRGFVNACVRPALRSLTSLVNEIFESCFHWLITIDHGLQRLVNQPTMFIRVNNGAKKKSLNRNLLLPIPVQDKQLITIECISHPNWPHIYIPQHDPKWPHIYHKMTLNDPLYNIKWPQMTPYMTLEILQLNDVMFWGNLRHFLG